MRTLAIIPARLGATRLPRKPLRLLGGAPLIVRVWQRVSELEIAHRVVVATDADEVATTIRAAGGEAIMTRTDHPSGTDRVAEVAEMADFRAYDAILNVQGDEPFISDTALRGVGDVIAQGEYPLATAATAADPEILLRPDVVKVVCDDRGRAMYFSRAPIPFLRETVDGATRDSLVRQHLGIYGYSREGLRRWVALPEHPLERTERLEQLRPLAAGLSIGVALIDVRPPAGIDTEDDLIRANSLWNELYAGRM